MWLKAQIIGQFGHLTLLCLRAVGFSWGAENLPPLPLPQNISNILKPLRYKNIHALRDFNQNLYNWLKSTKSKTTWFKEI